MIGLVFFPPRQAAVIARRIADDRCSARTVQQGILIDSPMVMKTADLVDQGLTGSNYKIDFVYVQ